MKKVSRQTVDLTAYPDLIVIYLGMRVNTWSGIKTAFGFGPKIAQAVAEQPEGLLLHEDLFFSLRHMGMRQYWRDFDSLERWARSEPHRQWWQSFVKNSGGTGFWHEVYSLRGGMEAVYDDMTTPVGFMRFAPVIEARGPLYGSRERLGNRGEASAPPSVPESDL